MRGDDGKIFSEPFVVYGIGKMTEEAVGLYGDQIVGLMDAARTGDEIYGKRILSASEVVAAGVKTIVIAAREANARIIYRRIEDFCEKNAISVYDRLGNGMAPSRKRAGFLRELGREAREALLAKIERADVVSFDIFDTLVMRRCLYPGDVFELSEKNTLVHTERELLTSRNEVVSILRSAVESAKEVWFVSDMHWSADVLSGFLSGLGIPCRADRVLVSCDHGVEKQGGLFEILKAKVGAGKRILHIGDSLEADYEAALQSGIDDAFHVPSRLQLFAESEDGHLLGYDHSLANRRVLGEFIAGNGDFAECAAPLIYRFMAWLTEHSTQFDTLLLCARDGFLLNLIREHCPRYAVPAKYFYTSRAAATLAGIFSEDDIDEVASYPFSGAPETMKWTRFRVGPGATHKDILQKAEEARRGYLAYIETLGIRKGAHVGLVDLVSSGTCLKWLGKFVDFRLTGLFLAKLADARLDASAMFDNDKVATGRYFFMKDYFALEEIMSSYEPTLHGFDGNGRPVFFPEVRTDEGIRRLRQCHADILAYGGRTGDIDFMAVDETLADGIFGLSGESMRFVSDEFCGRYE